MEKTNEKVRRQEREEGAVHAAHCQDASAVIMLSSCGNYKCPDDILHNYIL